jgi:hypothetical protein
VLWRCLLIVISCVAAGLTFGAIGTAPAVAGPAAQEAQVKEDSRPSPKLTVSPSPVEKLSLLDTSSPLKIEGTEGADTATAYLTLENPGLTPIHVDVRFLATSSEAVRLKEFSPRVVPSGEPQRVTLTFSGLKGLSESATGQIVVTGPAPTISQAAEVDPVLQPGASWPAIVIGASLAAALLLSLALMPSRPNLGVLKTAAPGPKLSFESWATTLTAAGAIGVTVASGVVFPTFPEQITKQGVLNLGIFFAALVVLAPFVFEALRLIKPDRAEEKKGRVGTNLGLLIACTITMWGVLGELGTLSLLIWELATGDIERDLLLGGIALVALLVARYFLISVYYLVRKQWAAEESAAATPVTPLQPPTPPPGVPPPGEGLVVYAYPPRRSYQLDFDWTRSASEAEPAPEADSAAGQNVVRSRPAVVIAPTAPAPVERWSLL